MVENILFRTFPDDDTSVTVERDAINCIGPTNHRFSKGHQLIHETIERHSNIRQTSINEKGTQLRH